MAESITEKTARFEKALALFLERVSADSNLLAAVLVGSLTEETVWRRNSISLWLIEKDGVTRRLRADGDDPRVFRTLVEEGVNLHVELIPRSRFKRMVEGSARAERSGHRLLKICRGERGREVAPSKSRHGV